MELVESKQKDKLAFDVFIENLMVEYSFLFIQ